MSWPTLGEGYCSFCGKITRHMNGFCCPCTDAEAAIRASKPPSPSLADIMARHPKTDKATVHSYLEPYEKLLAPYRRPGVRVLEIGLFWGDSMRTFEEYFSEGHVVGIDLCDRPHDGLADLRPMIAEGAHDIRLLNAGDAGQVDAAFPPHEAFDVIIEDASHDVAAQIAIHANFRKRLKAGGLYVIEDVQDIDSSWKALEAAFLDGATSCLFLDRRKANGRYDDVMIVLNDLSVLP